MMPKPKTFAQYVQSLVASRGLTMYEASDLCGLDRSHLRRIIENVPGFQKPRRSTLERIVLGLRLSVPEREELGRLAGTPLGSPGPAPTPAVVAQELYLMIQAVPGRQDTLWSELNRLAERHRLVVTGGEVLSGLPVDLFVRVQAPADGNAVALIDDLQTMPRVEKILRRTECMIARYDAKGLPPRVPFKQGFQLAYVCLQGYRSAVLEPTLKHLPELRTHDPKELLILAVNPVLGRVDVVVEVAFQRTGLRHLLRSLQERDSVSTFTYVCPQGTERWPLASLPPEALPRQTAGVVRRSHSKRSP